MKRIIFLIIIVALYIGSLLWKAEEVKIANSKDVPTLYRYWNENGVPVYTEIVGKKSLSNTVALTGVKKEDRVIMSLVAPRVAAKLNVGALARITKEDVIYNGKVSFISRDVDQLSGLYVIEITFSKKILSNTSVVLQVEVGQLDSAVVVKREAVSTRGGQAHVFIVENNIVERKNVILAGNNDHYYAVSSGVRSGEEVVVSDQRYLADQQKVLVLKRAE